MINKVYLLWHAYVTKEFLVIGSLTKKSNTEYIFRYEKDAITAIKLGCFLPFPYTDNEIKFNALPSFFTQRMLTSKFYIDKFNINYDANDELSILCYRNSVKNNDNFSIISEESYNLFNNSSNNNEISEFNNIKLHK